MLETASTARMTGVKSVLKATFPDLKITTVHKYYTPNGVSIESLAYLERQMTLVLYLAHC